MAKKRRYKLAQNGRKVDPIEGQLQGRVIGAEDIMPTGKVAKGPSALTQYVPQPTGELSLPWELQLFNAAAQFTTGFANQINDFRNRRDEDRQYLQALQSPASYNFNEDGYGDVPMYYQNGGRNYSIVDYLNKEHQGSDFKSRRYLFAEAFGKKEKYTGTADQNLKLLATLKKGWSPVEDTLPPPTSVNQPVDTPVTRQQAPQPAQKAKKTAPLVKDIFDNDRQRYFAKKAAQANGGKFVLTDKNNHMTYYGIYDPKTDSFNANKFEVLTGKNNDQNFYPSEGTKYLTLPDNAPDDVKVTPVGFYSMAPDHLYGYKGYKLLNDTGARSGIAYHKTYEGPDDMSRPARFNNKNNNDNNVSFGCINCQKPSVDALTNFVGNDPLKALIIHSGKYYAENAAAMKKNSPEAYKGLNLGFQFGGQPVQPILAEAGEVYQDTEGSLNKISDSADTHDDPSGGVVIPNAQRVLEDTSTSRKDKNSQALKLTKEQAKGLVGVNAKGDLSHAKAMEKASQELKKQVNRFESKLKSNVERLKEAPNDKQAQNSMKFNLMNMSNLPTEGDIFDTLFDHQETVKQTMGINNPKVKAQYGWDLWKGDKGNAFSSKYNMTNAARHLPDLDTIAMSLGYDGPKDAKSLQQFVYNSSPRAKAIIDKYHQEFGQPLGGMFDGKIGARWQMALQEIMRQTPVASPNPQFNIMPNGTGVGSTPLPDAPPADATPEENRFNFKQQPKSNFYEGLNWYDVAGPIQGILEGRELNRYNPVELNKIRLHQQNPLPQMQQGQRDFNTALQSLSNDGQGYANTANLYARKYEIGNQILGKYEDINKQTLDRQDMYNAQVADRQSGADQQAREVFERKVLGSREALRRQHLTSWNDLYTRLAQNHAFNRNANMIMKLFPAFDQNLDYNGYQAYIRQPLSMPNTGLLPNINALQNLIQPTQQPTKKYSTK